MNEILGKTIKVNGHDIHYYTAGQGEPLVVIHGGGGDARTWWENISELAEKYTVYAPDLPGYGGSQALDGHYWTILSSRLRESRSWCWSAACAWAGKSLSG
jgi:pimeloyl-ACP methyl ester carboxylesterase